MIEQLALNWYQAEKRWTDVSYDKLPERRKDEIRKRVRLVIDGEVRKSECGPGDLAIWFGRTRTANIYQRLEQLKALKSNDEWAETWGGQKMRVGRGDEYHRMVWYDTLDLDHRTETSTRLFGNHNVGQSNKSNMQIGGQLCSDQSSFVIGWWASCPLEDVSLTPLIEDLFTNSIVTMTIGDRPVQQVHLRTLFLEPQLADWVIPVRQYFAVEIAFYGYSPSPLYRFKAALMKIKRDHERGPLPITIHLDTIAVRSVM